MGARRVYEPEQAMLVLKPSPDLGQSLGGALASSADSFDHHKSAAKALALLLAAMRRCWGVATKTELAQHLCTCLASGDVEMPRPRLW